MKRLAAILALAAAVGGLYLLRELAKPQRIVSASYARIQSNGAPFARVIGFYGDGRVTLAGDSIHTAIDTAACDLLARHDLATLEPARSGISLQAEQYIRSKMKGKLLAYVPGGSFFVCGSGWYGQTSPDPGCDTLASFAWARWRAIRAFNAVVLDTSGALHQGKGKVDWTRPGVAQALADTCVAWATTSGLFNGVFVDELSYTIAAAWAGGGSIDYQRAGFASLAAWDSAYRGGVETFLRRLRKRLPSGSIIGANFGGAFAADRSPLLPTLVDFMMIENFPYQHGVTIADYLRADSTYAMGVWLTAWSDGNPNTAEAQRRDRFVRGVALLGDRGFGCLVGRPGDAARGFIPWWPWWDTGRPKGKPWRENGVWSRQFEKGTIRVYEADAQWTPTGGTL